MRHARKESITSREGDGCSGRDDCTALDAATTTGASHVQHIIAYSIILSHTDKYKVWEVCWEESEGCRKKDCEKEAEQDEKTKLG